MTAYNFSRLSIMEKQLANQLNQLTNMQKQLAKAAALNAVNQRRRRRIVRPQDRQVAFLVCMQ